MAWLVHRMDIVVDGWYINIHLYSTHIVKPNDEYTQTHSLY